MKTILFIAVAFLITLSFWCGAKYGIRQTRAELISTQAITLKSQRSEIEILKEKQAVKTKQIKKTIEIIANKAHNDLVVIEMGGN